MPGLGRIRSDGVEDECFTRAGLAGVRCINKRLSLPARSSFVPISIVPFALPFSALLYSIAVKCGRRVVSNESYDIFMRRRTLFGNLLWAFVGVMTLGVLILVGCKHVDSEQSAAEKASWQASAVYTLTNYDSVYAHGGVGFTGHLTGAEIALREIYKRSEAATVLAGIYPKCHPVGKAYVLSALWRLDTNRFRVLAEDFMKEPGRIRTMSGDIGGEESREALVRGMQYQSGGAFSPGGVSIATRKREEARRLRDTEELLSHDPNWNDIKSAFTVKEIWDVEDSAVITLATNVPSKREIRLRISAPWHDGKITIQHSASRLLAATKDLVDSPALEGIPKSKRIAIWGNEGHLFEERDVWDGLRKAMSLQADKSEWIEVVITDLSPEGWDENHLKLFHPLGSDVWLNENGTAWNGKMKPAL